jgi:hypothetical protein
MQQRPIARFRTIGKKLSKDQYTDISTSQGTQIQRSQEERVSRRTIQRTDKRIREYGQSEPLPRGALGAKVGRPLKMSKHEASSLLWYKVMNPVAKLTECNSFLKTVENTQVSDSTISREIARLGMKPKSVVTFSMNRDEEDRCAFWLNDPFHPARPGVRGVHHSQIIDIDEAGKYPNGQIRTKGHGFVGMPIKVPAPKSRDGVQETILLAVDTMKGVVTDMIYRGGTSNAKFHAFVALQLIPMLATGPSRIVTMDNLDAHSFPATVKLLREAGHIVIYRPKNSPDFGPVEWVFHYINAFLADHQKLVTAANFDYALRRCLSTVTGEDIAGYQARAHFCVPGFEFIPYAGQN